jgi:hypothetical protein
MQNGGKLGCVAVPHAGYDDVIRVTDHPSAAGSLDDVAVY